MLHTSKRSPTAFNLGCGIFFLVTLFGIYHRAGRISTDSRAPLAAAGGEVILPTWCMLEHVDRKFCLTVAQAHSNFRKVMQDCTWELSDPAIFESEKVWDWTQRAWKNPADYKRYVCNLGDWLVIQYGPFRTTGGGPQPGLDFVLNMSVIPAPEVMRRDKLVAITEYAIGNVDGNGMLLGYPPILEHHFHFGGANGEITHQMIMNNHGDSQCLAKDGGVQCLAHRLPPGYAFILDNPVRVNTEFVDVRPADSPLLESYVMVAMKASPADPKLKQIRTFSSLAPLLSDYEMHAQTWGVRTDMGESMVWHSGVFPAMEEIVESYLHAHAAVMDDLWLFDGRPEDVFSDVDAVMFAFRAVQYGPGLIDRTKMNILKRQLMPEPANLMCSYMSDGNAEQVLVGDEPTTYYRKANCRVYPNAKHWTYVIFFRPPPNYPRLWVDNHAAFRVYFTDGQPFRTGVDIRSDGLIEWG